MSDPNKEYEPIRPYGNLSTSAIFRFAKREQDCFYRSPLIWTERVFQVFQDMSGSEYSEPESVSLLDEPTGSVHEEAVRENSLDNGTPNLARKRHGEDNPDNAESSSPKKARTGSQYESLPPKDSPTDTGAKGPEDLGSVRLRLGGFPVSRSQRPANLALSVNAPSEFSTKRTTGHQSDPVEDRTDPFQSALRDAKKESAHSGKVPVSTDVPPLSGSSNSKYSLWTCGKQLKDILDIYFRTPLEDKSHSEICKQFPKPDIPALVVPELDHWLVLVGGKETLGQLRWEQNLQLTMHNYMDAAGPLCILLQHLQSDPSSVTERSAIDLALKSLRLLGHGVASVNKQRRQEIVKHCNITDVTQLAKQSDPMQTYLFGESKASELNFVGDLAEKVSKAVQSKKNSNSNKSKPPYKQARSNSFKSPSGSTKPRSLYSHEHQPFRKAPFRGKRGTARDYPEQSRYKNFGKKPSTQTAPSKPTQVPR